MLPIIRTTQSDEDLIAIWRYVALEGKSPDAADQLLRTMDRRIALLAKHPLIGEQQPQLGAQTRRLIVGNYLVYYEAKPDAVHVLRIFHAARRVDDLFS